MEQISHSPLVNHYLSKYRFRDRIFDAKPHPETGIIVVIPCFCEENLLRTLESLHHCHNTHARVEVMVIVNSAENANEIALAQNRRTMEQATKWMAENRSDFIRFFIHNQEKLPAKHAGVGLARKIGMDEAVDRFEQINNNDGIIVCFDADSMCDKNYLIEIEKAFAQNPKATGASIYFEHPLAGEEFEAEIYEGIQLYELFLRYYRQAFKFTGHPQAYHTIGSSMAVKSSVYQSQGGMNKRKAGEDFYFLQKVIQQGGFIEINSTRVIPSPRKSERVPFGTGRAIKEFIEGKNLDSAYSFSAFLDIREFIAAVFDEYESSKKFSTSFYEQIPQSIRQYLLYESDWETRVSDLVQYGTTKETFSKRFFNWFNAFRVLKFVHFYRDNFKANVSLLEACQELMENLKIERTPNTIYENLMLLRKLDREGDK